MTEYCLGFVFDEARKHVVLIRKNRPKRHRDQWNGVGGHIEEGEDPIAAMSREFAEEAGWLIADTQWQPVAVADGVGEEGKFRLYIFAAFTSTGVFNAKTITDEPVARFLVESIPSNVVPNLRWIIPLCLDTSIPKPLRIANIHEEKL